MNSNDVVSRWRVQLRAGRRRSARLRRELGIILLLVAVGAVAFASARTLARQNDALKRQDARAWRARGEAALMAGRPEQALRALRRASTIDRRDRLTAVLLARALRGLQRDEEAAEVLSRLSALHPTDVDINLELAHLEADRGDIAAAIRRYESAIESLWTPDAAERQRDVRLELVDLLLKSGMRTRALAHLLVLSGDAPVDSAWQVRLGRLFLTAGDSRRALEQFTAALAREPGDVDAQLGAGTAAFTRGSYGLARRYLAAVDTPVATEMKATMAAIANNDPLAARLRAAGRFARLLVLLQRSRERLAACVTTTPVQADAPTLASIDAAIEAAERAAGSRRVEPPTELEEIEDGIDLALRAQLASSSCSGEVALDRAIPLIARIHGLAEAP